MYLIALLVLAIAFIIFATAKRNLHPFLALIIIAFGILSGMPLIEVVKSVNDGFGGTIGTIGIVILAGSIIGTFLERSGGADDGNSSAGRHGRHRRRSSQLARALSRGIP